MNLKLLTMSDYNSKSADGDLETRARTLRAEVVQLNS